MGGILAFHHIYQPRPQEFASQSSSIAPRHFRDLVCTLRDHGYSFLSMSDVVERLASSHRSQSKFVCLTFDDGYADNYTAAYPICREYGVPMTIYLITGMTRRRFPMWWFGLEELVNLYDRVEVRDGSEIVRCFCRTLREKRATYLTLLCRLALASPSDIARTCDDLTRRYGIDFLAAGDSHVLTSDMIAEMQASGLVEFGAHTVHHARLASLPDEVARREIEQSKRECEALTGTEARHFAYPYGDAKSAGARELVYCREVGFTSAVTTVSNTLFQRDARRMLELPRLSYNGAFRDPRSLDLLLSGVLPGLKRQWDAHRLSRMT